jgi:nucleoside-diphosphate-sugar epimerase
MLKDNFVDTFNQRVMKFIVTGSLGNISKPLTERLVEKGHHVTVVSSDGQKIGKIKALGRRQPLDRWKMPIF